MNELISGKEALIALENGEEVEYLENDNKWHLIDKEIVVISALIDCKLRLKPRTITINGIEVPAPLSETEQRKGAVFYLNDGFPNGYALMELDPLDTPFCIGAWRTEEEIKQVVAALRSIFGKK